VKLKRRVIVTTIRFEETCKDLTEQQLKDWNSGDEQLQEWVIEEVQFELVNDKVLEDTDWPELKEEQ
tara:strand:- start:51 stop:251 length:201 start_codon:yes stop_codon:yes gene_type:complete